MRYLTTIETQDGSVTPAAYAQARWHELGGSFPTQTSLRLMAGELDQDGHSFRATLPQLSPVTVRLTGPELAAVLDLMPKAIGPDHQVNLQRCAQVHLGVRHVDWETAQGLHLEHHDGFHSRGFWPNCADCQQDAQMAIDQAAAEAAAQAITDTSRWPEYNVSDE
jgi:hypothetical protein